MTPSPKELLCADKDLRTQLAAVTNQDWFKRALCFVRAEMLSRPNITPDMQKGMTDYETVLLTITDAPESERAPLTSGLHHDLDSGLRERRPKDEKKT